MKRPERGDIYWVKNVPSRDRWDNKTRPVVVIHVLGDSVIALAITTKFARPPKDYEIIVHDEVIPMRRASKIQVQLIVNGCST
jgi:mRNA-degrading endonuclease toxin of MazEF toxin-antitoxin module